MRTIKRLSPLITLIAFILACWNMEPAAAEENSATESGGTPVSENVWFENWDDGMWMAKKENKPVIVDFYSEYCGPCKWMEKVVFEDPGIKNRLARDWVSIKIDVLDKLKVGTVNAKKMNYIQLSQYYRIHAQPTFLFFDKTGKPVQKSIGSMKIEEFGHVLDYMKDELYKKGVKFKDYKESKKTSGI